MVSELGLGDGNDYSPANFVAHVGIDAGRFS
jgi:hypothetical protein